MCDSKVEVQQVSLKAALNEDQISDSSLSNIKGHTPLWVSQNMRVAKSLMCVDNLYIKYFQCLS